MSGDADGEMTPLERALGLWWGAHLDVVADILC